jgi:hypothetical protein
MSAVLSESRSTAAHTTRARCLSAPSTTRKLEVRVHVIVHGCTPANEWPRVVILCRIHPNRYAALAAQTNVSVNIWLRHGISVRLRHGMSARLPHGALCRCAD